ncbi:hypothetical protein K493DRAFT_318398 [Basidiobolus meristosporus CBS 931.73]|uniref:Uncharacterized protein n=1 Tax=Basidiobolus meristosporus CBS 931.73 TaxID=1314790 RepID=A0A1Y1XVP8_9FUNG|nr:hypothetical protein K493DRAFT_318398 [Basidiobolus meristosporus CBS 931.73]|eukprot:ORX89842.1 hypothetical protein K493DRAFT_318398 [Basidiobolus meristosporus CBS 931.73]
MEDIYAAGEKHELNSLNGHINPRDFGTRAVHAHPREFLSSNSGSQQQQRRRHSVSALQEKHRNAPYPIPNGKETPFGRPRHSSDADLMERIIFTPREGDHDRTYNALCELIKREIWARKLPPTQEQIRILTGEIVDLFVNTGGSDQEMRFMIQQLFPNSPPLSTEAFAQLVALAQRLVQLNYTPNAHHSESKGLQKGATLPHAFMSGPRIGEVMNDDEIRVGGRYSDVEYDSEISTRTEAESDFDL